MKKLFLIALALVLLTGAAWGQAVTLDQHNNTVIPDSLAYLVGQTTDTSTTHFVGYYSECALFVYNNTSSSEDSSSITTWIDIAPTTTGPWYKIDSLVCDSAVANLPATNFKDIGGNAADGRYLRVRTENKNGANDSSLVAIRLFLKE